MCEAVGGAKGNKLEGYNNGENGKDDKSKDLLKALSALATGDDSSQLGFPPSIDELSKQKHAHKSEQTANV